MMHWNGTSWSPVSVGTMLPLYAVWGAGPNDAWVSGAEGTIQHWNGTTWSDVASGSRSIFFSLWGDAAGDVWAVGYAGTILRHR